MHLLKGQTALVTGSGSGIGAGIARAMASAGANVVVNYASGGKEADRVVNEIKSAGGRALKIQCDVSKENQVIGMFQAAVEEYGAIDILVNNAGVQKDAKFMDMTMEQWQQVLDVNLTGGFLCAREAIKIFLQKGVVQGRSLAAGKIIFISSVHEVIPWAGHANYAASKGGIMLLMKTLAQEFATHRIRVNSIAPGAIKTDLNRSSWDTPEAEESLLKLIPYERIGEPKDVAPVAVWLASDESDYMTGTTLYVDGGMLLYPGFRTEG